MLQVVIYRYGEMGNKCGDIADGMRGKENEIPEDYFNLIKQKKRGVAQWK